MGRIIEIERVISKEMYDILSSMNVDEQSIEIKKTVPREWLCARGYYGYALSSADGEYKIIHRVGEYCD